MNRHQPQTAPTPSNMGLSRRSLYLFIAITFLSLIGLADSLYLTVKHYTGGFVPCTITSGCEEVLNSSYATILGVPLAALGALAYFSAFSLATLAIFGNKLARKLLFYQVALMLAFSIWLFIIQAFILHHYCQFCLLSAATTLLLTIVVILERLLAVRKQRSVKG